VETKFTPWRLNYIKRDERPGDSGCVFCAIGAATANQDAENLLLLRGERCYVVLNRFPYNAAHLMVLPFAHTADLVGLDETTANELFTLTRRTVALLTEAYQPHGFNIGMNLGRTAGAGIAEHLHMHIVPRWQGDTNFMPVVGGTKLIPEDLGATYKRLRPLFQGGAASDG
jgi:ATP adenylyltransferase